jgi:hypothetical protein
MGKMPPRIDALRFYFVHMAQLPLTGSPDPTLSEQYMSDPAIGISLASVLTIRYLANGK